MAAFIVEFVRRTDQADVAFLDQIEEGTPRPMYFFATLMTSRELARIRCSRASIPSSSWRSSS